jgi:hypothetical protein
MARVVELGNLAKLPGNICPLHGEYNCGGLLALPDEVDGTICEDVKSELSAKLNRCGSGAFVPLPHRLGLVANPYT